MEPGLLRDLEEAVHRHSSLIRIGRRALIKLRYNSSELPHAVQAFRRLGRERRRLINVMRNMLSYAAYIPQNLAENIDALTFFVYEVSVNEERELLRRLSYVVRKQGIELDEELRSELLEQALREVEELERVSRELLSRVKG